MPPGSYSWPGSVRWPLCWRALWLFLGTSLYRYLIKPLNIASSHWSMLSSAGGLSLISKSFALLWVLLYTPLPSAFAFFLSSAPLLLLVPSVLPFVGFVSSGNRKIRKHTSEKQICCLGEIKRIVYSFSCLFLNSMIKSWFFADNFSRLPIKRLDNEHLVFLVIKPSPPHRSVPPELIGTFSAGVQFSHVLCYKEWHSEISVIHHPAVFQPFLPLTIPLISWWSESYPLPLSCCVICIHIPLVLFPSAGLVWVWLKSQETICTESIATSSAILVAEFNLSFVSLQLSHL